MAANHLGRKEGNDWEANLESCGNRSMGYQCRVNVDESDAVDSGG